MSMLPTSDEFAHVTTDVSPYKLAKIAGVVPQMVYSYVRQGFITATRNELGHIVVSQDDANEWLRKRAEKASKATETEPTVEVK